VAIENWRKLPSLLGNLYQHSLEEIYRTPLAEQFREGSSACRQCRLRPVCRGCPAVVSGLGGDIFNDIDPYCFIT
jgi:radical SAM protein with 4Fe4S-binding SPASM domain